MSAFTEARLDPRISFDAKSASDWRTIVTEMDNGDEDRDRRWAHSRKRFAFSYNARKAETAAVIAGVHQAMAGQHTGFRFLDHDDFSSGEPGAQITATDQPLGIGDGTTTAFQMMKEYTTGFAVYRRPIYKPRPVPGPLVAIDGAATPSWTIDFTTGIVTFTIPPASGAMLTAGFVFDVPVRFESDSLEIDLLAPGVRGARDIRLKEDPRWKSATGEITWVFVDAWADDRGGNPLHELVNVALAGALA